MTLLVEKLRADMERLVDIAHKMGQEDHRDRLRDLARVIFRHLAFENADAVRDHVDDVPFRAAHRALVVFLRVSYGHIRVVEPVVRRSG